jgi:hypothetical protein
VDIDADGDYDLFCGHNTLPNIPSVALYINQGDAQNPQLVLYNNDFITNPEFFVNVSPVLVDIDADGDHDLFMIDGNYHFYYYQNNGTPQWPEFVLITNQWQGINSGYYACLADLDGDLDLDLIMSATGENLYLYRNVGWPQNPQMALEDTTLLPGSFTSIYTPYLADIDSDDDYDIFVGHVNGGLLFFRNITGDTSAVGPPPVQRHPQAGLQISLGPNPANPFVAASFELRVASNMSLDVYDLLGRRIAELASGFHLPGEYRYVWDAAARAAGMYFVRLRAGDERMIEKIVLVK